MKRAEEVADFIVEQLKSGAGTWDEDKSFIANRLTAFADEQIKDATVKLFEGDDSVVANIEYEAYQKGRAEGLKEAAKIAGNPMNPDYETDDQLKIRSRIASAIRKLKDSTK